MDCSVVQEYISSNPFRIMLIYQVSICILPLLANLIFVKKYHNSTIVPPTIKLIVAVSIGCDLMEVLLMFGIPAIHLYHYVTVDSACDALVSATYCVIVRLIQVAFMFFPTFLHVVLSLERIRVCNLVNYMSMRTAIVYCVVSLFCSFIFAYLCFYNADTNRSIAYCSSFNHSTMTEIIAVDVFLIFLEIFSIIALVSSNYFQIRRKPTTRVFDINQRYRRNENNYVYVLLLPWLIFHFVTQTLNLVLIAIIPLFFTWNADLLDLRTFMGYTNTVPICCFLSPLLLAFLIHCQKIARKMAINDLVNEDTSAENYFKRLALEWNAH